MSSISAPDRAAARLRAWLDVPLSSQPSVAFDGISALYLGTAGGLPEVWAVPTERGPGRRVFSSDERIGAAHASPTGPRAVIAVDSGGNERWQLGCLDLSRGPSRPRPLLDEPESIHFPGHWREDGRHYLFSSNARDPRFFDVLELDLDGGIPPRPRLVADGMHTVVDAREGRALIQRATSNLDHDLFLLDGERTVHLTPHDGELSIFSATLHKDGVYAAANPGRERAGLVRYRPGQGKHEFIREFPGEVELVRSSPDGRWLAVVVNRDGWSETHLVDPATRETRPLNSGPRGVIGGLSWLPDSSAFLYELSSVEGSEIFRRAIETGKERRLTGSPASLPSVIDPPRLGRARTEDGIEVPYWEYTPRVAPARGTVLHLHGGPESQARPAFGPFVSFLVEQGLRVIAPNVRGSTGYGRTFTHLDDGRRRMDAVRDVRDVALTLVRAGQATAGRIGLIGGSYGGFLVLSAAVTYPDLWGAAVDLVGIANFVTFLENTAAWRRPLREAEYGRLDRDREFLASISPVHQASRIRAPLLVLHGRNDPRVPASEAEQIVTTLRELGRPVELRIFDDEGHGIVRRENQVEAWEAAVRFFAEHLTGPGGPAETSPMGRPPRAGEGPRAPATDRRRP